MGILRFKDGIEFNTDGEYRVVRKVDGYYVVGHGMLCPVKDRDEGYKMVKDLKGSDT